MEQSLPFSVIKKYKQYDAVQVHSLFESEYKSLKAKMVVLDDDPTGIQTVHDVNVYTDWEKESVLSGFKDKENLFFILTNSRSFSEEKTKDVHTEIAKNVCSASKETGVPFILFSRGDSTLRGHFPLETETLKDTVEEATGEKIDGEIIIPFFPEGGRYTINDIHYVKQGDDLYPAGQTEFAKDKTFGYSSSNLKDWCSEKSAGRITSESVVGIELDDLRALNVDKIEEQLLSANGFRKIIVNAVDYTDLEVFGIAFLRSLKKGKKYIFRCAAAIVKVLGNISSVPLLNRNDLIDEKNHNGGIVLVGSHVKKTTLQFEQLHDISSLEFIEFNQHRVLEEGGLEDEVKKTVSLAESFIEKQKSVVVYTRRERIDFPDNDPEKNLAIAVKISDSVTSVIAKLHSRPSFIVAKGGITSSDVGTKALRVKKARVMGQIQPGIPVWMTGTESKFPDMPYVIFPGNVGDTDTLKKVVETLL